MCHTNTVRMKCGNPSTRNCVDDGFCRATKANPQFQSQLALCSRARFLRELLLLPCCVGSTIISHELLEGTSKLPYFHALKKTKSHPKPMARRPTDATLRLKANGMQRLVTLLWLPLGQFNPPSQNQTCTQRSWCSLRC